MNTRTSSTDLAMKTREKAPLDATGCMEQDDNANISSCNVDGVQDAQAAIQFGLAMSRRSEDIRAEKVDALRAQIEAGTYEIDTVSLAKKMLGLK